MFYLVLFEFFKFGNINSDLECRNWDFLFWMFCWGWWGGGFKWRGLNIILFVLDFIYYYIYGMVIDYLCYLYDKVICI